MTSEEVVLERVATELTVAVIGDVLDALGRHDQVLPPRIAPLDPRFTVVGRAMPVLMVDVFGPQQEPFGRLTEALDSLRPHDVWVAHTGRTPCAAWGEILTAVAREHSAAGAVLDGYHRDSAGILDQQWPVFSQGACAADSAIRSRVADFGVDVRVDAVTVHPGDLVVGDRDGVVVVPQDIEAEVVERALVKVATERQVRQAIRSGMSATEAYSSFGVL